MSSFYDRDTMMKVLVVSISISLVSLFIRYSIHMTFETWEQGKAKAAQRAARKEEEKRRPFVPRQATSAEIENYLRVQCSRIPTAGALCREPRQAENLDWQLSVQQSPAIPFAQAAKLSSQFPYIRFASPDYRWAWLPSPTKGSAPLLISTGGMKAWRCEGATGRGGRISPDGRWHSSFGIQQTIQQRFRKSLGTIHRWGDSSTGLEITGFPRMLFVSPDRVAVGTAATKVKGFDQNSLRNRVAEQISLINIPSGLETPLVEMRQGGVWGVSPNRQFVVIVQPDADTSEYYSNPDEADFLGAPNRTEIDVYDSVSGDKVASAVYPNLMIGAHMSFSWESEKLLLKAPQALVVVDMTNGKLLLEASYADPVAGEPYWLPGGQFFVFLDNPSAGHSTLVDADAGRVYGGITFAQTPHTYDRPSNLGKHHWIGEYIVTERAYARFPLESLHAVKRVLPDPNRNVLAHRQVNLQVSSGEEGASTNQTNVRLAVATMLKKRCNLEVVEVPDDSLMSVSVTFDPDRPASLEFIDPSGRVIYRCQDSPNRKVSLTPRIPDSVQFMAQTVCGIGANLKMEPVFLPQNPDLLAFPCDWPVAQLQMEPIPLSSIEITNVDINQL